MAYVSSQRIDSLPAPLQQRIRAHLRADANEATESIAISKLVAYNIDSWFSNNPVSISHSSVRAFPHMPSREYLLQVKHAEDMQQRDVQGILSRRMHNLSV